MLTAVRSAALAVLLSAGLALVLMVPPASAASPSPGGIGDTRSSGQGAGFAGQPILVAVGVVVLGLATVGVTTLYVRATRQR